jgi:hypothetical protein
MVGFTKGKKYILSEEGNEFLDRHSSIYVMLCSVNL